MNEEFLQYIWLQELYNKNHIAATGENIQIISPGEKNIDAGPDFQNARIKIDDTIWAGNVEIHTDSSNWIKHKHHLNQAYDNVVLHVVDTYTKEARRTNGQEIPTIVLEYDPNLFNTYKTLLNNKYTIPCETDIKHVDRFIISCWLNTLCIERLESKSGMIQTIFEQSGNNWEETFYIVLARSFGFNTNALPFELTAKSLPLKYLLKNKQDLNVLEALLFGQAGFLNESFRDNYYTKLQKEYSYLQKAYQLKPIEKSLWKFMRLRPVNFPTIRIAQFANLIFRTSLLFSKTLEIENLHDLFMLYEGVASEYWNNHFTFGKESIYKEKKTGKLTLQILLINTIIPFLFIYGQKRNIKSLQDKAIRFLEEIPSENNTIIRNWRNSGLESSNAFQSQALIHLTKEYCTVKNCLYCQLGNSIIRKKTK